MGASLIALFPFDSVCSGIIASHHLFLEPDGGSIPIPLERRPFYRPGPNERQFEIFPFKKGIPEKHQ